MRIVIYRDGGNIYAVSADSECKVLVIDEDVDGLDEDEITLMRVDGELKETFAFTINALVDPDEVDRSFRTFWDNTSV